MTLFEVAELGLPIMMLVAVVASVAIGLLIRPVSVRVYRERVRRLTRSCRALTEQRDQAEEELREDRQLVDRLATDLTETRQALRAVLGCPHLPAARHITTTHAREIAARPVPGEPSGAHATTTHEETTDV